MNISEKEALLIKDRKIKAVLRWQNIEEKAGDLLFEIDGTAYRLVEKKRWAIHRIAAQRSSIDFGCDDVSAFRNLIEYLYGSYNKLKNDVVYDIIFKADRVQKTLSGGGKNENI